MDFMDDPVAKMHPANWARYVGNAYQVCGTRHYQLTQGFCRGVNAIDVRTGGGLEFTIVPDRGLDISLASYRGVNLTFLTPKGEANPAYFETAGSGWIRTFFAGLLTTCGIDNVGTACEDQGAFYGQHGRRNIIPAKNVCDFMSEAGEITISGILEDGYCFGPKIRQKRTIVTRCGENRIRIFDEFENVGCKDEPLLLLYHINFGYPLLSEQTRVVIDAKKTESYNDYSAQDAQQMFSFSKPDASAQEKNYFHVLDHRDGYAVSEIRRKDGSMGVYIRQKTDGLPYLNHWKLENPVDYVLALEPSNVRCLGRRVLRESGELPIIRSGEKQIFEVEIGILD